MNKWHFASTQWCERGFVLGIRREWSADGALLMASPFDVFDYGLRLTWVARLYDGAGVEVASAQAHSKTALHRIVVEADSEDRELTDAESVGLDIAPENEAEATRAAGPK